MSDKNSIDILMVDDNPGDARLTQEALKEVHLINRFNWVSDGEEAMAYLRREGTHAEAPRPDLILLDLNLPRKDGREVLAEIKADRDLKRIPVIILTTSQSQDDITGAYYLMANCYVRKPVTLDQFVQAVRSIKEFWFSIARLPAG
jgi:two-component system, chemotaxis family, response regulator Rcp1